MHVDPRLPIALALVALTPVGCSTADNADGVGSTGMGTGAASDGEDAAGSGVGPAATTSGGGQTDGSNPDSGSDGSGSAAEGLCPAYAGLGGVGTSWDTSTSKTYEARTGISQDVHREVTAIDRGATTIITVVATTNTVGEDSTSTAVATSTYACDDDGAWLQSVHTETEGVSAGMPVESSSDSTYAPAWLEMVWNAEVGTTWMAASTITTTTVNGPFDTELSQTFEVTGTDSASTAAGEFDVLVFSWSGGGASGAWLGDAEVGTIPDSDASVELVAYNIVPW